MLMGAECLSGKKCSVSISYHLGNAKNNFHRSVEAAMYRSRRRAEPAVQTTAADFAAVMADPSAVNYNEFYRGTVTHEDDLAVVFASQTILSRLGEVHHGFYDGTFFCVPRQFYQCFSLMGIFGSQCLPVVHVLMTAKNEQLYKKVTDKIKEIAPNFAPETLMGDYEVGSRNAMQATFPTARVGGCMFHFDQALWRKCQKLGLTDLFRTNAAFKVLIKRLMALPYLPSHQIRAVATELFAQPLHISEDDASKVTKFKRYFFRFWMTTITTEHLSIHDFVYSTNNFCESFHSRHKATIRVHHPAIWAFPGHLNHLIHDTMKDLERVDQGLELSRPRKKSYQTSMEKRAKAKQKFIDGTYTTMQYLAAVSHAMDTNLFLLEQVNGHLGLGTSDDEQDDGPFNQQQPAPQHAGPTCAVCLGPRLRTVVFQPCHHADFCADCSAILEERGDPCPLCRQAVQSRFEIFQS